MDRYLAKSDAPISATRNATDLSRFCERLVRYFLDQGASSASVNVGRTGHDIETLYKGLWNVCVRAEFRGRVRAHKQDGTLMLIRERKGL